MSKRKKTGGKDFVKGNPIRGGRPKMPPELHKMKTMTKDDLTLLLHKMFKMGKDDIINIINNPKAPSLEVFIARIIQLGVKAGDTQRLDFLLNRMIGTVKQKFDHTTDDKPIENVHYYLPDNGLKIKED